MSDEPFAANKGPYRPGIGRPLILAAAVICGACVMVTEILGARVVGPYFGVSLFVWTALITVTLLSLALGYFAGGRVADRWGSPGTLAYFIGAAGLCLLALPLIRGPVLIVCSRLGIRMGALAAAAILFGPTLTLLGTVAPISVRLFLRDLKEAGRTVGWLSALSTLGSFTGTVAAGFWLVPHYHIDQIAAGTAVALLGMSALLLTVWKRLPWGFVFPALGMAFLGAPPLTVTVMPSGTKAEVVHRCGSYYGEIKVVDYSYPPRRTREMVIGGVIQGAIDMGTANPLYPFTYALERAALHHRPQIRKALVIGLGPGNIPSRLQRMGVRGTAVEIDPSVVGVAKGWFGFREGAFKVVVEDGRTFLDRAGPSWDAIFLDAFSSDSEPSHLFTREAFLAACSRLEPGGVLAINISGLVPGPGVQNRALDCVIATMNEAFEGVFAYPLSSSPAGSVTNFTLVGIRAGGTTSGPATVPPETPPSAERHLSQFMKVRYVPAPGLGEIYCDEWAPLDAHNLPAKLMWRREVLAGTPWEILLD